MGEWVRVGVGGGGRVCRWGVVGVGGGRGGRGRGWGGGGVGGGGGAKLESCSVEGRADQAVSEGGGTEV